MLEKSHIESLKEILGSPLKIVITTHKSPDGDAMGSSLGLYHYLKKKGHDVMVISPNNCPLFLQWLPGYEYVLDYEKQTEKANGIIANADIIFCLDFNSLKRIDEMEQPVADAGAFKVMIDHHQQPDGFARYMHWNVESSSTCELVFDFITLMDDEDLLDTSIAQCIYTGIMTDTASFRFPSSSAETHIKAARLIELGLNHSYVHEKVYDTNTYERLQLMGYTLCNKFKILKGKNVVYIWLTEEELKRYNYQPGDTEGFVNYGLSIDGIKLSAFFVERDGKVKISFRSKSPVDVNQFARQYFEGGGHKNAAGGQSDLPIEKVIERFVYLIETTSF